MNKYFCLIVVAFLAFVALVFWATKPSYAFTSPCPMGLMCVQEPEPQFQPCYWPNCKKK